MSEPRNYIRATTGGFNATTVDAATYTQLRNVWTTTTNSLVGVFGPAALGRDAANNQPSVPSYARVMLSGVVVPGDQVRVLNSAGVARFAVDASVIGTDWLFLAPDDSIAIASAGATSAEILVLDFTEENAATLILAQVTQANGGSSSSGGIAPQSSQNMAATGAINAFDGDLVVFVNAAATATLTLPALGSVALGSTVTVIRLGGNGLPTIVVNTAADQINGLTTPTYTPYPLRSLGDAVRYKRVPSGWERPQGAGVPPVLVDAVTPTLLAPYAFAEGTMYVEVQAGGGGFITLGPLAQYRVGSRFVIFNSSIAARSIEGQAGQNVNGQASVSLPAGLTAIVESAGTQWYATISA